MKFNAGKTHYKSKRLHLYLLQVQISKGLPPCLQPGAAAALGRQRSSEHLQVGCPGTMHLLYLQGLFKSSKKKERKAIALPISSGIKQSGAGFE
jgi:hypothetical protein